MHALPDNGGIGLQESQADIAGEGEIGINPLARRAIPQPIIENPTKPARFAAMGQKEILIAPS